MQAFEIESSLLIWKIVHAYLQIQGLSPPGHVHINPTVLLKPVAVSCSLCSKQYCLQGLFK